MDLKSTLNFIVDMIYEWDMQEGSPYCSLCEAEDLRRDVSERIIYNAYELVEHINTPDILDVGLEI